MLADEIIAAQRAVKTDAYQMSVGEIVNMYRDNELIIDPEFQRLFRWDPGQKSKLFESILLGIPLPPIFVFEREDTRWELIDGLQRLSTILEFMGFLRDPDGGGLPPSVLEATKYLPSLYNTVWERSPLIDYVDIADQLELTSDQRLSIRRSRLGVEILKKPSDNDTKYDLFQRLNAGGSQANAQELRNCVIIMANRNYFLFLKELSDDLNFLEVSALTDDQYENQRPMEFVSRFVVHLRVPYDRKLDVEEYVDDGIVELANKGVDQADKQAFVETFRLLKEAEGANALRKQVQGVARGKVTLIAFEVAALGVAFNIDAILLLANPVTYVKDRLAALWANPDTAALFSGGMRGTTRIQKTLPFGRDWFRP